jgi:hypothetical protein
MKHLRQYIRKLILEVYELDDEQIRKKQRIEREMGEWYGTQLTRSAGLQDAEGQRTDRKGLQGYQHRVKSDRYGQKMIQAFMNGEVTILHSIDYRGATSRMGMGGTDSLGLASEWIKKYGKRGKDSLSTVAFIEPPTSSIARKTPMKDNALFVGTGRGLILKGYPVYVGENDTFTQTLGAIDNKMKAHWKNSGIPKRPAEETDDNDAFLGISNIKRLKRLGYSNETILDNWTVIGTYINEKIGLNPHTSKEFQAYIEDSLQMGLPCNVYDENGVLVERHTP